MLTQKKIYKIQKHEKRQEKKNKVKWNGAQNINKPKANRRKMILYFTVILYGCFEVFHLQHSSNANNIYYIADNYRAGFCVVYEARVNKNLGYVISTHSNVNIAEHQNFVD